MKNEKLIKIWTLWIVLLPVFSKAQETLSLEKCRQMALEHNYKIMIAEEQVASATQMRKAAFTQYLPGLNFLSTYQHLGERFLIRTPQIDLDLSKVDPAIRPLIEPISHVPPQDMRLGQLDNFIFNLSLIQPLYAGGKIRNINKNAKYMENMALANKNLEESEIIYKVDEAYWRTVSLTEQLYLAKMNKATIDRFRYDVENYREEGIITKADLLKVMVKTNDAALKVLRATNGLELSTMALCQIIGIPLDSKVILTDTVIEIKLSETKGDFSKQALSKRPEINLLENSLNISKGNVKMMFSRFLPTVGLTANANFMNPNPYDGMEKNFGFGWNVGITCAIPVFHWYERGYTLRIAKHQQKISEYKVEEAKEMITLQVKQAQNKLSECAKKIELTAASLAQAEENLKIISDNFKEGMAKIADVLEAQTLWQQSYYDNLDAKSEYRVAQSNFMKVLGDLKKK